MNEIKLYIYLSYKKCVRNLSEASVESVLFRGMSSKPIFSSYDADYSARD